MMISVENGKFLNNSTRLFCTNQMHDLAILYEVSNTVDVSYCKTAVLVLTHP